MTGRQVWKDVAVAGQVTEADLAAAAAAGVKTILNNRPDGEEPGQPSGESLAAAAARLGMAYRYIPVYPGRFTMEMVEETRDAIAASGGPVLAFCRSGARSTNLWALSAALAGEEPARLIEAAAQAGYDISGLSPALESLRGRG